MKVLLISTSGKVLTSDATGWSEVEALSKKGYTVINFTDTNPSQYKDGNWYGIDKLKEGKQDD